MTLNDQSDKDQVPAGEQPEAAAEEEWHEPTLEEQRIDCIRSAKEKVVEFLSRTEKALADLPGACAEILAAKGDSNTLLTLERNDASAVAAGVERERVLALLAEVGEIIQEKGVRFGPALLTSREHDQCGSSGHGGIYWETDPDVPIPLLEERLIVEGRMKPEDVPNREKMTLEEIDRARRLRGMQRLDLTTGRVTGEVDLEAVQDSYIFLPPERKAAIQAKEAEILAELKEIAGRIIAEQREVTAQALITLEQYSRGQCGSLAMSLWCDVLELFSSTNFSLDLAAEVDRAKQLSFQAGKRDAILTPQEISLRIDGQATVAEKHLAKPYVPLAVQDGTLTTEEVNIKRQEEGFMVVETMLASYQMPFGFRLEELGEDGSTAKSPTFVSRTGGEDVESDRFKEAYQGRMNVPFARPGDWFAVEAK